MAPLLPPMPGPVSSSSSLQLQRLQQQQEQQQQQEVTVCVSCQLAADVYNLAKLGWEPLVDPWDVQVC